MAEQTESFGDPRLVNPELAPIPVEQRNLGWRQLGPLWAVVGLSPGILGFAVRDLPTGPALAALAIGLGMAALLGSAVSWSAARFGLGFVPLCRAAFGARGALLPLFTRWLVGAVWLGVWASELGHSMVAVVGTRGGAPAWLGSAIGQDAVGWGIGALLVGLAWWVAGGVSRLRRTAVISLVALVPLAFVLVVLAGIESEGFGGWLGRQPGWAFADLAGAAVRAFSLTLPAVIACADWQRFRRDRHAPYRSPLDHLAPALVIPAGVGVAFASALLASAAHAVRHQPTGDAILDATAFGGVPAALLAVAFVLCSWIGVASLVGTYSSGLAVCGMLPQRAGPRAGATLTAAAALAVIPLARGAADRGIGMDAVLVLLAAPFGVLLFDELLVRRGRILLEELYLLSRKYGPVGGVTLSAVLALVVGWVLHPGLLSRWPALQSLLVRVHADVLSIAVAALLAGAVFVVLAPLERLLLGRRPARAPRANKTRGKPAPMDLAETAGLTDPRFVGGAKKRMQTLESDAFGPNDMVPEAKRDTDEDGTPLTLRDAEESKPGERKSTEEQRMEVDWSEPED